MNTDKQFILINYYDGDLKIGQQDPDWPEWVVVKQYDGEDLNSIDTFEELRKLGRYNNELRMLSQKDNFNLRKADGTPFFVDITPN